jgi:hypothetical protein
MTPRRADERAAADPVPPLAPEEEQGLEEALRELDRGEGVELEDVRTELDAIIPR